MKRLAGLSAVVALSALLAACSPGINSAVGIGLDARGRLTAAVKVCAGTVSETDLSPVAPQNAPTIGSWRRNPPMPQGVETWGLREATSGHWAATKLVHLPLAADREYLFGASNKEDTSTSHTLVFRGRDVARLKPGQLLVERLGPTNSRGETELTLAVIPIDRMAQEACTS